MSIRDGWILLFGLVAGRSFRMRLHLDTFLRGVPPRANLGAFDQSSKHYLSVTIPLAAHQWLLINATCSLFRSSLDDEATSTHGSGRKDEASRSRK